MAVVPVPATATLCGWSIETACIPDWDTTDPAVQDLAATWAAEILYALTGRRYGQCPVVWRPCNPSCAGYRGYLTYPVTTSATGAAGPWMIPFIDVAGTWRNCVCPGACSCRARCEVPFPTPVASVTEVKVDGVIVPATSYRVDRSGGTTYLVRIDGECWPECQDMELSDTEVGAFSVEYVPGEELPASGVMAAGRLAGEFVKACLGGDCRLPEQLASLSRTGVEVQMVDPATFLESGLTGVQEVDLWIRSVNPNRLAARARAYSPDMRPGRFTA